MKIYEGIISKEYNEAFPKMFGVKVDNHHMVYCHQLWHNQAYLIRNESYGKTCLVRCNDNNIYEAVEWMIFG